MTNPRSTFLERVISKGIVERSELNLGDYLDWDIRSPNKEKHAVVKKIRNTG